MSQPFATPDVPATLWKLQRDGKELTCLVRLVPYGIEIDIEQDGQLVVTRAFETDTEALAWADKKRTAREGEGWQAVPTAPPQPDA